MILTDFISTNTQKQFCIHGRKPPKKPNGKSAGMIGEHTHDEDPKHPADKNGSINASYGLNNGDVH